MGRKKLSVLLVAAALAAVGLAFAPAAFRGAQQSDRVTVEELKALVAEKKAIILDVRLQADTKIKGAVHIPLGEVEARAEELPRDKEIVTYCA
jgi:hypothetical protein